MLKPSFSWSLEETRAYRTHSLTGRGTLDLPVNRGKGHLHLLTPMAFSEHHGAI